MSVLTDSSDYSPSNTDPHVEPSRTLSVKYGHNYHGVLTKNVVTVNFDPPPTPNSNQFILESMWMIVSERRFSGETVISCRWSKEETHVIFIFNGLLIKCESAHSSNTPSSAATPVCPQKDGAMKSRFFKVFILASTIRNRANLSCVYVMWWRIKLYTHAKFPVKCTYFFFYCRKVKYFPLFNW